MTNEELNDLLVHADELNKKGLHHEAEELASCALSELKPTLSLHYAEGQNETDLIDDMRERDVLYCHALAALSDSARHRQNYNLAMELALRSIHHAEAAGHAHSAARARLRIGLVHLRLSEYDKALEYFAPALAAFDELGDKSAVAHICGNIGLVHNFIGSYDIALSNYARALSIHEELADKSGVASGIISIGNVHIRLGSYDKAFEYLMRAMSVFKELDDKSGVARTMVSIGNVHQKLGSYDKAIEHYLPAISAFEEISAKSHLAIAIGNIGNAYNKMGSYDKALEYYRRALAVNEELGVKRDLATTSGNIGALYATKDYPGYDAARAEEYLLRSLSLSIEIGYKAALEEFHKTLSELYEQEGRDKEALIHFRKHIEFKDQINAEEVRKQFEQREREKQIELAKAASDAQMSATTGLLHKVLPEAIAARMLSGEEEIADYYTSVSILFADIAGFTPLSADMPAIAVVRFLNFVFAEFDRIIFKYGCEKIKTIGDGYMAVCGAPLECADHAERLAAAALEMQEPIVLPDSIREHLPEGTKLGLRIGLHTGSVVGGVIGEQRFVYDIYSDAVNIAARMESHGVENRIHVSNDFFRHLQNRFAMTKNTSHGMTFEKRGEIEIKGKGMMRTYFLEKA